MERPVPYRHLTHGERFFVISAVRNSLDNYEDGMFCIPDGSWIERKDIEGIILGIRNAFAAQEAMWEDSERGE